jgi:hypothetical protein
MYEQQQLEPARHLIETIINSENPIIHGQLSIILIGNHRDEPMLEVQMIGELLNP